MYHDYKRCYGVCNAYYDTTDVWKNNIFEHVTVYK